MVLVGGKEKWSSLWLAGLLDLTCLLGCSRTRRAKPLVSPLDIHLAKCNKECLVLLAFLSSVALAHARFIQGDFMALISEDHAFDRIYESEAVYHMFSKVNQRLVASSDDHARFLFVGQALRWSHSCAIRSCSVARIGVWPTNTTANTAWRTNQSNEARHSPNLYCRSQICWLDYRRTSNYSLRWHFLVSTVARWQFDVIVSSFPFNYGWSICHSQYGLAVGEDFDRRSRHLAHCWRSRESRQMSCTYRWKWHLHDDNAGGNMRISSISSIST